MNHTPARLKSSSGRYQDPKIRWVPPKLGASAKPTSARRRNRCHGFETRLCAKVSMAHTTSNVGRKNGAILGRDWSASIGNWPTTCRQASEVRGWRPDRKLARWMTHICSIICDVQIVEIIPDEAHVFSHPTDVGIGLHRLRWGQRLAQGGSREVRARTMLL